MTRVIRHGTDTRGYKMTSVEKNQQKMRDRIGKRLDKIAQRLVGQQKRQDMIQHDRVT